MTSTSPGEVTRLLGEVERRSQRAYEAEELLPLAYNELRALARSYLRREHVGHTLQPTALVHEAYLSLLKQRVTWQSRAHFCAVAAMAMRRILVQHALRRRRAKRGGRHSRVVLDAAIAWSEGQCVDVIALDEALSRLATLDQRQSRVVELRFFGGLSIQETASVLGVAERTVHREWVTARAYLRRQIIGDQQ